MSMHDGQLQPAVTAGWYPDPHGAGHRWWDGARWTEQTQAQPARTAGTQVAPFVPPVYGQPAQAPSYPGLVDNGYAQPATTPWTAPAYSTPGSTDYGFGQVEKPKNGLATAALVAGIVVVLILVFLNFAIASGIAIILSVRALQKARAIKASGYPTAVGMGRAIAGLVLSAIGALIFVLSFVGS